MLDREDLKKFRHTQKLIQNRLAWVEEQKSVINRLTAVISGLPKGSKKVQDQEAESIVRLENELSKITEKMVEEQKKLQEIEAIVDKVEQPYSNILYGNYILDLPLVKIAADMGYTYKHLCKMKGEALNKFERIAKEHDKKG